MAQPGSTPVIGYRARSQCGRANSCVGALVHLGIMQDGQLELHELALKSQDGAGVRETRPTHPTLPDRALASQRAMSRLHALQRVCSRTTASCWEHDGVPHDSPSAEMEGA